MANFASVYYADTFPNPAAIEPKFYRATEYISTDNKYFATDENYECSIEIVEQPQNDGYKFNSLCEDENLEKTCIKSKNSIKKHPTVKFKNFDRKKLSENLIPLIEVELRTSDGFSVHPYILKCDSKNILSQQPKIEIENLTADQQKERKLNPCIFYYYPSDDAENIYELDGLNIIAVPKYSILEELESYYYKLQQFYKKEFKMDAKFFATSTLNKFGNLKQAKIKVQGVLYDKETKMIVKYVTHAVKTEIINDIMFSLIYRDDKIEYYTQLMQNMRIVRASKLIGNINGDEEVILFVAVNGNVDSNDLEIEFNQRENNQPVWSATAKVDFFYNNSVIIFRTPSYDKLVEQEKNAKEDLKKNTKTSSQSNDSKPKVDKTKICEHPVKVFFRLLRKSTKEYSSEWTFYYSRSKCTILDDLSQNLINELNKFLNSKSNTDTGYGYNKEDSLILNKSSIINEQPMETGEGNDHDNVSSEDDEISDDDDDEEEAAATAVGGRTSESATYETVKNLVDDRRKKMNLLVDRTCAALLEVAQSRSIHKLIKIQRYLLNVQNTDGNTPIHLAILNGHFDLVEIFVDIALTIPHYNIINVKNSLQLTPLLLAAHMEEYELCNFLLESTANLADIDLNGQNCFHIAAKKSNFQLTKVLINYVKSNPDKAYLMNLCNYEGDTPFHIACKKNAYEIAEEYLFSDLCRINAQNKRTGETPLHYTSSRNYLQLTKLLVKHLEKNSLDIDVQAYNGCTPLHVAIANRNYLIVRLLTKANANTYIQSIESVHGNFFVDNLSMDSVETFFMNFNKLLFIKKAASIKTRTDFGKTLEPQTKIVQSTIKKPDETVDKFAVQITDVKPNDGLNSNTSMILDSTKQNGFESFLFFYNHCYNSFYYASKDPILLKLIGDYRYETYLPKDEINVIMDNELKKKLIYKLNLKNFKTHVSVENARSDFLEIIESQMQKLSENFRLKMRLVNNESEQQTATKRRPIDETDVEYTDRNSIDSDMNEAQKPDYKRTRMKESS